MGGGGFGTKIPAFFAKRVSNVVWFFFDPVRITHMAQLLREVNSTSVVCHVVTAHYSCASVKRTELPSHMATK